MPRMLSWDLGETEAKVGLEIWGVYWREPLRGEASRERELDVTGIPSGPWEEQGPGSEKSCPAGSSWGHFSKATGDPTLPSPAGLGHWLNRRGACDLGMEAPCAQRSARSACHSGISQAEAPCSLRCRPFSLMGKVRASAQPRPALSALGIRVPWLHCHLQGTGAPSPPSEPAPILQRAFALTPVCLPARLWASQSYTRVTRTL